MGQKRSQWRWLMLAPGDARIRLRATIWTRSFGLGAAENETRIGPNLAPETPELILGPRAGSSRIVLGAPELV